MLPQSPKGESEMNFLSLSPSEVVEKSKNNPEVSKKQISVRSSSSPVVAIEENVISSDEIFRRFQQLNHELDDSERRIRILIETIKKRQVASRSANSFVSESSSCTEDYSVGVSSFVDAGFGNAFQSTNHIFSDTEDQSSTSVDRNEEILQLACRELDGFLSVCNSCDKEDRTYNDSVK